MTEQKGYFVGVGNRFKELEALHESTLSTTKYTIFRVDGKKFSTYTRPFDRPVDNNLQTAMINTTECLVKEFGALVGFTQSDEISLVFAPKTELSFGGRVLKWCTLLSGYTSSCFTDRIRALTVDRSDRIKLHVNSKLPYFDCRAFQVESKEEVVEYLLWRSYYDFKRNSKMNLARHHLGSKSLHKLRANEAANKLFEEKGIDWNELPLESKYGSFSKRVLIQTGETIRSKYISQGIDMPAATVARESINNYINW
jgi:tRNA(His) guanylyltransferase